MKFRTLTALLVIMFTLLFSCREKGETKDAETDKTTVTAPKPINTYTNGEISVDAYSFDGLEHFLSKNNDTTYVVNFWATWCVPCVEELPHFEKLNAEYKDEKVKVLLVSLDMHKMIESRLLPFIKENNLQSDVVVLRDPDADSWIPKVDGKWTGAIPATVIYKGDKRNFYEKSFTYEELEKEINNFK